MKYYNQFEFTNTVRRGRHLKSHSASLYKRSKIRRKTFETTMMIVSIDTDCAIGNQINIKKRDQTFYGHRKYLKLDCLVEDRSFKRGINCTSSTKVLKTNA